MLRLQLLYVGKVGFEALGGCIQSWAILTIALWSSQVGSGRQVTNRGLQLYFAGVDRLIILILGMQDEGMPAHLALFDRLVAVDDHLVVLEGALEADRGVAGEALLGVERLGVAALNDEDFVGVSLAGQALVGEVF